MTQEKYILTHDNINEIFGRDAAELETPERLKAFFIKNASYSKVKQPHPVSLVVGQKGIGKTALLKMSAHDDAEANVPNVTLKGSQILKLSDAGARASIAIETFKKFVEDAILDALLADVTQGVSDALSIGGAARGLLSRLTAFAAAVARNENAIVSANAHKLMPWVFDGVTAFNVYIDDTDVEWNGSKESANVISNLIQSCYNIAAESSGKIRFKISVRSDLFNYLRTHADYIDKIQSSIVRVRWTNDDILRVVAKRIGVYCGFEVSSVNDRLTQEQIFDNYYIPFFDPIFEGVGAWERTPMRRVLMSFVRQRPRDLVAFCTLSASEAIEVGGKISAASVSTIIPEYSRMRLDDTVKEFKSELPEIDFLLREMRPRAHKKGGGPRYRFNHAEMIALINEIIGRKRLTFSYSSRPALAAEILDFLFRINFLVGTKQQADGKVVRRYYDFADDVRAEIELGRWGWEVHMAYRWAIKRSEDNFWAQIN